MAVFDTQQEISGSWRAWAAHYRFSVNIDFIIVDCYGIFSFAQACKAVSICPEIRLVPSRCRLTDKSEVGPTGYLSKPTRHPAGAAGI